jgi:hypothetical protein
VPLSHRGYCIFKGEIAISQLIYNKLDKIRVLYTSADLLAHFSSHFDKNLTLNTNKLLRLMPSPNRTLKRKKFHYLLETIFQADSQGAVPSGLKINLLSKLIEKNNPSHVASFLYPLYLSCPFIKKDLCSAGCFSIAQAVLLFRESLESSCLQANEIIDIDSYVAEYSTYLHLKGTPLSNMKSLREAAQRGVTPGFIYSDIFDGVT